MKSYFFYAMFLGLSFLNINVDASTKPEVKSLPLKIKRLDEAVSQGSDELSNPGNEAYDQMGDGIGIGSIGNEIKIDKYTIATNKVAMRKVDRDKLEFYKRQVAVIRIRYPDQLIEVDGLTFTPGGVLLKKIILTRIKSELACDMPQVIVDHSCSTMLEILDETADDGAGGLTGRDFKYGPPKPKLREIDSEEMEFCERQLEFGKLYPDHLIEIDGLTFTSDGMLLKKIILTRQKPVDVSAVSPEQMEMVSGEIRAQPVQLAEDPKQEHGLLGWFRRIKIQMSHQSSGGQAKQ